MGLLLTYFKRKSRERAMSDFYKEHSLILKENKSAKIRENLRINVNPNCCSWRLNLAGGEQIPIYWCEWFIRTEIPGRTTASVQIDYYLAIFFAPKLVSDEFMRKAIELAGKNETGVLQKLKDQFMPDTYYPFRAEKLPDGTFVIGWQMERRRELYEEKLAWLKNNVSAN